jgi:hypothetical protein
MTALALCSPTQAQNTQGVHSDVQIPTWDNGRGIVQKGKSSQEPAVPGSLEAGYPLCGMLTGFEDATRKEASW